MLPEPIALRDARHAMVGEIAAIIQTKGLKQVEAARVCRTDAASLSKVLRGRSRQISLEKLTEWLTALGKRVTIAIDDIPTEPGKVAFVISPRRYGEPR